MATNKEVLKAFEQGKTGVKSKNVYIKETQFGKVLYNYKTPLAYRNNNGNIYVGDKKYSSSTSAIQNDIYGKRVDKDNFKEILGKAGVKRGDMGRL